MNTEVNIGDIWKWESRSDYRRGHKEYWLIIDCTLDKCWIGICLQGEKVGTTDELTLGESEMTNRNWEKVA